MNYFIVIDMQNDFITGSLKNDKAKKIISGIVNKIQELKNQDYVIVGTHDTHDENYLKSQEGKNLPIEHCMYGSEGWKIVPEIDELIEVHVNKYNFGFSDWKDVLVKPEKIVLCGTVTSICVASNATILKSLFPECEIEIISNLCADISDENHQSALNVMKVQQIKII